MDESQALKSSLGLVDRDPDEADSLRENYRGKLHGINYTINVLGTTLDSDSYYEKGNGSVCTPLFLVPAQLDCTRLR